VPYDFEPMANHAIAKNIRLLEGHVKDLHATRKRNMRKLIPDGEQSVKMDKSDPRFIAFEQGWIDILNQDIPVNVYRVAEDLFHFDTNPVPLSVQKGLAPILIDVPIEDHPPLGARVPSALVQDNAESCACGRGDSAGGNQE